MAPVKYEYETINTQKPRRSTMCLKQCWVILFCVALAAPAAAQFYKYKDREGNVRFTDDLSQVPESQQSGATSYEQSESRPEELPASGKPEESKDAVAKTQEEAKLKQDWPALEEKKKQLDTERKALMDRRAALEKTKNIRKTRTQEFAYNKEVTKLNDELLAFEKRMNEFNAEVESNNQRIKEAEKNRLEQIKPAPPPVD